MLTGRKPYVKSYLFRKDMQVNIKEIFLYKKKFCLNACKFQIYFLSLQRSNFSGHGGAG
jgi:hypothetical protein